MTGIYSVRKNHGLNIFRQFGLTGKSDLIYILIHAVSDRDNINIMTSNIVNFSIFPALK